MNEQLTYAGVLAVGVRADLEYLKNYSDDYSRQEKMALNDALEDITHIIQILEHEGSTK